MTKYELLEIFLRAQPIGSNEVTLAFRQVEQLIGAALPESAFAHREWWSNQTDISNRPQARAWISAGFEVDTVNRDRGNAWVHFKRK